MLAVSRFTLGCLVLLIALPAAAQVVVFDDQTDFVRATAAAPLALPGSETAFPGTSCGPEPSGSDFTRGARIALPFDANSLTVTQDLTAPGNSAFGLCIFDPGFTRTPEPSVMIANTIVGQGEDDFLLTFDQPVHSLGFRLLTNFSADEVVTLRDSSGGIISLADVDALTSPNTRVFLGFKSRTPVKSVLVDTLNGHIEDEGIDEIRVATRFRIEIDIKPGSDPNCFHLNGHGVIPVALLGSAALDVADVDPESLLLDGLKVRVRGARDPLCSLEEVNGDEYIDLVCHFEDDPRSWTGGLDSATLFGELLDGTLIVGEDSVCVVP